MNSPTRVLVVWDGIGDESRSPTNNGESWSLSGNDEAWSPAGSGRAFEFLRAGDADEAVRLCQTEDIDCVVVSGDLSDGDGLTTLEGIHRADDSVPLLYCRGRDGVTLEAALTAGATDWFSESVETLFDQPVLLGTRLETAVDAAAHRRQEQTELYRTLLDSTPVPMVVIDENRTIQYANEQAMESIGADDIEEVRGREILTFVPAQERDRASKRLDHVFERREPAEIREYLAYDLDGEERYIRGSIVPTTFNGSSAAQLVLEDVTEQRQHEERIEQQRRQIERLHDVGVELASCESERDVYELMVDTAEDILDLDLCVADSVTEGQLTIEATSSELTEYDEAPAESEEAGIAGKAYLTGNSYLVEDARNHPDAEPAGEYRSGITVPIGDYGVFQAAACEVGAFDHTDLELVEILAGHAREALTRLEQERTLRKQRDELTRENERLDEFTSIVSHDLRNPLNVATLRLDLLEEDCDSPHLSPVQRAIERMETLIEDLLTLAREGEAVSEFDAVSLANIVRGSWTSVETGDATLNVESKATILADESRFQQLLENLIRNAVEHAGEEVRFTVGTLAANGFYVADDGPGIPDEVRESLFEPGVTTDTDGNGLGLAIVSRIAEAHGWTVTVADAENGGARFEFAGVEFVEAET